MEPDRFSGPWRLFDYKNEKGKNEFADWTLRLQKVHRIKLRAKLDLLIKAGPDLPPKLLAGPIFDHVYKLRIETKNVQLRPILCKGPINNDEEFTLLLGAFEIGGEYDPKDAESIAAQRRMEVISDHNNRRCKHERVT